MEVDRLNGELAAKATQLEQEQVKAKGAQAKAMDFGEWGLRICRGRVWKGSGGVGRLEQEQVRARRAQAKAIDFAGQVGSMCARAGVSKMGKGTLGE